VDELNHCLLLIIIKAPVDAGNPILINQTIKPAKMISLSAKLINGKTIKAAASLINSLPKNKPGKIVIKPYTTNT
jgi:hypothetical protein